MDKVAMDAIMQTRIEKFNKFAMSQDIDKMPIGLYSGKMGICIYFYHQARLTKNKEYEKFAEKLLDSIYNQVHTLMPIDIENGLTGICYGINYLIEQEFVKGNVNSIIKEMDDKIFRTFCFELSSEDSDIKFENLKTIVKFAMYFNKRLENSKLHTEEQYLFKNIIIKSINKIEDATLAEKFSEPFLFSITNYFLPFYLTLLCETYKLDFYNYKIIKIFDELSDKLRSTYPLLQSNRLFLSTGIKKIERLKSISGWKEHSLVLEQNTDFYSIMKDEFRNKNIFPNDGLVGFYFLTKYLHTSINIDYDLLSQKIVLSDVWKEYLTDPKKMETRIGLASGFGGVIMAYQDIQGKLR